MELNQNFHLYCLTAPLGKEPVSETYLAFPVSEPERRVILKVFSTTCLGPGYEEKDFLRDGERLQLLKSPHLVPVLDVGVEQGQPFVVYPHLTDDSLQNWSKRFSGRHASLQQTLHLSIQLAQALGYCHEQGIVHGNLRPANVLLQDEKTVLLSEFGLASLIDIGASDDSPTPQTVAYSAPEQSLGIVSQKSDQFSLGCVLYELFTGTLPFAVSQVSALSPGEQWESPTPPSQVQDSIPEVLEVILLKALAYKPSERYGGVTDLIKALQGVSLPALPVPTLSEVGSEETGAGFSSGSVSMETGEVETPLATLSSSETWDGLRNELALVEALGETAAQWQAKAPVFPFAREASVSYRSILSSLQVGIGEELDHEDDPALPMGPGKLDEDGSQTKPGALSEDEVPTDLGKLDEAQTDPELLTKFAIQTDPELQVRSATRIDPEMVVKPEAETDPEMVVKPEVEVSPERLEKPEAEVGPERSVKIEGEINPAIVARPERMVKRKRRQVETGKLEELATLRAQPPEKSIDLIVPLSAPDSGGQSVPTEEPLPARAVASTAQAQEEQSLSAAPAAQALKQDLEEQPHRAAAAGKPPLAPAGVASAASLQTRFHWPLHVRSGRKSGGRSFIRTSLTLLGVALLLSFVGFSSLYFFALSAPVTNHGPQVTASAIALSHSGSKPTRQPTAQPTKKPTGQPTKPPTAKPTTRPTTPPVGVPETQPTLPPVIVQPTLPPAIQPTSPPQQGTMESLDISLYGWNDNSPEGNSIAYPSSNYPTVHNYASGTGTYDDPMTVSARSSIFPVGTRFYMAYVHKYFVMEDECPQCNTYELSAWIGGDGSHDSQFYACEDSLTREPTSIEVNPPAGREVETKPLFNAQTGACFS
jgi:serine/threonine protein kinase